MVVSSFETAPLANRMLAPQKHLYDFGPFRLDLRTRMLLRDGAYVPLTPKALEALAVLVENSGRIVDKEELLHLVWPGTFVEEATLAKTVSILRKALGEGTENHYIDTVPKRGYRFAGAVSIADGPGVETAVPPAVQEPAAPVLAESSAPVGAELSTPVPWEKPKRRSWFRWVAAVAVVLAAFGAYRLVPRLKDSNTNGLSVRAIPVTSFPGRQNQTAFSPDGNQIAFVWDSPQDGGLHIYVKMIGSEALLQLTHGAGVDSKPAWSPDGQNISFLRSTLEDRAWYVTSAIGGSERRVAEVRPFFDLGNGNSPYFSPNGKTLAVVDKETPDGPASIFLVSLDGSPRRKLTTPPQGTTGDYYPAFSPDGKRLAFARAISFSATDLYVLQLANGRQTRLTFDGLTIEGLAWTADSREIIFSSRRGGSFDSLWRISATGGTPERVSAFGEDAISPAVSRDGKRLAYTRQIDDMNIWSMALDGAGRLVSKTPLITSIFRDSDPDFSPDGKRIAFISGRAGGFGVWVSGSDGSDPRLLFDGGPYVTGSPRWSPDGRWIAFDTRADDPAKAGNPSVRVISAEGGAAHRLIPDRMDGVAPSWSHDGKWIYCASTETGSLEVWKTPTAGGAPVQITRKGGFEAFESADGLYLYYLKGRGIPGIWRVGTNGGEEILVTDRDQAGRWRAWRLAESGIYYASAAGGSGPRIAFLELPNGGVREILKIDKSPDLTIPSLAVSPDGHTLLYAQYDQSGSNIMMLEGFR